MFASSALPRVARFENSRGLQPTDGTCALGPRRVATLELEPWAALKRRYATQGFEYVWFRGLKPTAIFIWPLRGPCAPIS